MERRQFLSSALAGTAGLFANSLPGRPTPVKIKLTREEMEEFLQTAEIERIRPIPSGITNPKRATLNDGCLTHDAHIQTHDEYKLEFKTVRGTYLNFADSYKHNIAAYLLDQMLDLRMTPVSVERKVRGDTASVTWWVDDVLMSEKDRYQKEIEPPDRDEWNRQIYCVRVFDELIYNIDRNLGNLLITRDWTIWMIDHTRGFRPDRDLRNEKNLERCDRRLLESMKRLTFDEIKKNLDRYLKSFQMDSLLKRRDRIVEVFEKAVREKGEMAVLYDYLPRPPYIELFDEPPDSEKTCWAFEKAAG